MYLLHSRSPSVRTRIRIRTGPAVSSNSRTPRPHLPARLSPLLFSAPLFAVHTSTTCAARNNASCVRRRTPQTMIPVRVATVPCRFTPRARHTESNLISVRFYRHPAVLRSHRRLPLLLLFARPNVRPSPLQLPRYSKISQSSGGPSRTNLNSDFLAIPKPAANAASFLNGRASPDPL